MYWEEFNRLCGFNTDYNIYSNEVEPTYMTFDWLDKDALASMYAGKKEGAYSLWLEANNLYKEKLFLQKAIDAMHDAGYTGMAEEYEILWQTKANVFRTKVEKCFI